MATTFTIANGAALSNAVKLGGTLPVGIAMPSVWTAANITLQLSLDNVTFLDVYMDDGTELVVQAAASRMLFFSNVSQYFGVSTDAWVRLRSGTSGVPVNQGAARELKLLIAH